MKDISLQHARTTSNAHQTELTHASADSCWTCDVSVALKYVTAGHGRYSIATDWQKIMQSPKAADKAQGSYQVINQRLELMTSLH